ncbi:MAG: hypothetical protein HYU02_05520 [Thaumarchaeota archaeon]|nr:hypothetical protein [Nitrososphaerota archaeon]
MNGQNGNDGIDAKVCVNELACDGVGGAVKALETAERNRTSGARAGVVPGVPGVVLARVDYFGTAVRANFVFRRVPECLKAYLVCAAATAQAGAEGSIGLRMNGVKHPAATLLDALSVANNDQYGRHTDFDSAMAATDTITRVQEEINRSGNPVGVLLGRLADTARYGNLCAGCPNYQSAGVIGEKPAV